MSTQIEKEDPTAGFSLSICGKEVDPDRLTEVFGVTPTHVARLGQSIGQRPVARTNVWSVQSEHFPLWSLEEEWVSFEKTLSFLKERGAFVSLLPQPVLSVLITSNGYHVHFRLSPELLEFCRLYQVAVEIQMTSG